MRVDRASQFKTEYPQAAKMVDRYDNMKAGEKDDFEQSLKDNPKLREFLQMAIKHLEDRSGGASDNHDIAHFLMGKLAGDKLPGDLANWVRKKNFQPTHDLCKKLDDLLKTFQKGWTPEDPSKTLEKLKFLSDRVENLVDTSFSGGTKDGIDGTKVKAWMFEGAENPWLGKSRIHQREPETVKPTTNEKILISAGHGPASKNIFIFKGKVTDLKIDNTDSTRTTLVLETNPDLLLCQSYGYESFVVQAAGPGLQTEIFENQGIPNTRGIAKKLQFRDTAGQRFSVSCGAHDMRNTHGIDEILLINQSNVRINGKLSEQQINNCEHHAAEILSNRDQDSSKKKQNNIIMQVSPNDDSLDLAMKIAQIQAEKSHENPKKLILVSGSDDAITKMKENINNVDRVVEEALARQTTIKAFETFC